MSTFSFHEWHQVMTRGLSRAIFALLLIIGAFLVPTTAQAATAGQWYNSSQTTSPTVYWTNIVYSGFDIRSTTPVPAGATITSVQFNYKVDPLPTGTTLYVWLCIGEGTGTNQCVKVNTNNLREGSGTTDAFNGVAANQPFRYALALGASTTRSLSPNNFYSNFYSAQVNYTY
jgi:hypothetical protein